MERKKKKLRIFDKKWTSILNRRYICQTIGDQFWEKSINFEEGEYFWEQQINGR